MDRYKIALQRIMFDKEMDAYADALDKAKAGDIITAIIGGLGQIAAGVGERITARKENTEERDYYSNLYENLLKEVKYTQLPFRPQMRF